MTPTPTTGSKSSSSEPAETDPMTATEALWQQRYAEAAAFHAAHARLPKQRESAAGKWLAKQRDHARHDALLPHRAELLAQLPDFRVDHRAGAHADHVTAVEAFAAAHGRMPWRRDPGMENHAQWVQDIRAGKITIPAALQHRLEAAGFSDTPTEDRRDDFLTHYAAYVARYGTTWVKVRFVCADGYPLGERCRNRRIAHSRGELSAGHERALESAGFPWVAPADAFSAPGSEHRPSRASKAAGTHNDSAAAAGTNCAHDDATHR